MRTITAYVEDQQPCCMNCQHFYQHYVKWGDGPNASYYPTFVGHCTFPRTKERKVIDICERFEQKPGEQPLNEKGESSCRLSLMSPNPNP